MPLNVTLFYGSVARGITETEVVKTVMLGGQPTNKFVQTDVLPALALSLCSNVATWIMGTVLPVNDGWTTQ